MTTIPYVHSNFERIPGDFYPTIDRRCIYGFLEHFTPKGQCVDVCAPEGSGIVDALKECGYAAHGIPDALTDKVFAQWVVTNPPYKKGLVDEIIYRQIERVQSREVEGFACLLRSNFSYAKSRTRMFKENPYYFGKIELLFRPWWNESRKAQPIHNYVWQLWTKTPPCPPVVLFSKGCKPLQEGA